MKEQWKIYKQEIKEVCADLRTKGRRKLQIPNILTSLRLLAPAFILPASFFQNIPLVLVFVVVFSLTDMIDGFIARTFHLTSEFGKDLDAFCDKIFAGTLLLASSFQKPILLISLFLEMVIASINMQAKINGKEAKSLFIGKVKTFYLFSLIAFSLIENSVVFKILLGITTILQIGAIFLYKKKYQMVDISFENKKIDQSILLEKI